MKIIVLEENPGWQKKFREALNALGETDAIIVSTLGGLMFQALKSGPEDSPFGLVAVDPIVANGEGFDVNEAVEVIRIHRPFLKWVVVGDVVGTKAPGFYRKEKEDYFTTPNNFCDSRILSSMIADMKNDY